MHIYAYSQRDSLSHIVYKTSGITNSQPGPPELQEAPHLRCRSGMFWPAFLGGVIHFFGGVENHHFSWVNQLFLWPVCLFTQKICQNPHVLNQWGSKIPHGHRRKCKSGLLVQRKVQVPPAACSIQECILMEMIPSTGLAGKSTI